MRLSFFAICRNSPRLFSRNNFPNIYIISSYFPQSSSIICATALRRKCSVMEKASDPTLSTGCEVPALASTEVTKEDEGTENNQNDCGKRKCDEPEDKERRAEGRGEEEYIPPPQKRNPGVSFSLEHFNETSYYFENGLRKVHPYYYDFKTYCKGRWIGKSLMEVFKSEFRSESIEYYQRAAKEGRIRLNDSPVDDLSIVLRNNDHMRNTVHRHEPPVVGKPMEVLVDDGEVLVVDKPASIPVHPCGRFRHNTVIFILGKERGISELHTVHRLDRLTSGVLLFARNLEMSKKLDQLVRDRQLVKEYVCRVEGEFPQEDVTCEEPIMVVSFKIGLCRVDPKGKDCRTVFQRLSFNGRTSVVRCLPLTGRTHQIRVHLQYLGFPILNDPIYGSSAWGPHRGKGGLVSGTNEEILEALVEEHQSQESLLLSDIAEDAVGAIGETTTKTVVKDDDTRGTNLSSVRCERDTIDTTVETAGSMHTNDTYCDNPGNDSESKSPIPSASALQGNEQDHLCRECKLVRADPTEKELIMYLHALCYKGPDFEYSTGLPDWAKDDWKEIQ
uniref:Pseudouridylate synthase RPUSD2 n=1 Tax=Neogobius melanostomus TaxID=47308 RepID=A0A8C6U2H2_9GOBI